MVSYNPSINGSYYHLYTANSQSFFRHCSPETLGLVQMSFLLGRPGLLTKCELLLSGVWNLLGPKKKPLDVPGS